MLRPGTGIVYSCKIYRVPFTRNIENTYHQSLTTKQSVSRCTALKHSARPAYS